MNYYKRNLGDYARDTAHLSQGQIGAYDLMLDWYYANERPLPADKADVYRIARAFTRDEKKAADKVLGDFFAATTDGWVQKRADEELARYATQRETNRVTGKKGGRPKKETETEPNGNRIGFYSETETEPNNNPNPESRIQKKQKHENPDGFSSPEPLALVATGNPADGSEDQAAPPSCPVQRIVDAYHAELPMLPRVRALPATAERMLRTRWREDGARQTVVWWREFFAYVRTCPFLVGAKTDFTADLLWLVRPVNFAKVVNGNFEGKTA